jgi:hypothetical protein
MNPIRIGVYSVGPLGPTGPTGPRGLTGPTGPVGLSGPFTGLSNTYKNGSSTNIGITGCVSFSSPFTTTPTTILLTPETTDNVYSIGVTSLSSTGFCFQLSTNNSSISTKINYLALI